MKHLIPAAAAAGACVLLPICAIKGRRNHPGLAALRGWRFAHRGLYGGDIPENSLAAFREALRNGYGVELDVHLLKDGTLAILHDSDLLRMTGRTGVIEDLTAGELGTCFLNATGETIPTFQSVLELFDGQNVPMIVELKTHNNNHAALCAAACRMLDSYRIPYWMESFDSRCLWWLKKHRPEIVRGQLAENFLKTSYPVPKLLKWMLRHNLGDLSTMPDFVAYRFEDRKIPANRILLHFWHMQGVSWTIRTPEDLAQAEKEGWIPIFEGFRP